MKYKLMNYILILLLLLSLAPAMQMNAATDSSDAGQKTVTTTDNVGRGSIPDQSGMGEFDSGTVEQPQLSSDSEKTLQRRANQRGGSHFQMEDYQQAPQEIPNYLTSWETINRELEEVGVTSSYSFANDALLRFENKKVEYVVETADGKFSPDMVDTMKSYNVDLVKSYPNQNFHVIDVPLDVMEEFVQVFSAITQVNLIEPNFYAQASFIPNDPFYPDLYGMQIIGMEDAWDVTFGSMDILVAVIDTGIDYNHIELAANYVPLGYDHYNNDNDPWDDEGHGTHVAGTIAASINNGIGVAGVANVSVMAEKFLDEFGFGSAADGAAAINHAVTAGADILSNSWGGSGYSQLIDFAVQNAVNNGSIVVAAAGNSGSSNLHYPAALPGVIAVSATDQNDNLAGFSNYGDWIDIAAPGVGILSTLPFDNYAFYDGTSMATPHVSGLLALLMSVYPEYTPTQLENLLYSTAVDLGEPGFDPQFGHGRIDAATAIYGIQDHDLRAEIDAPQIVPNGDDITLNFGVTNLGLENETDVYVELSDEFGVLDNFTISSILPGESFYRNYTITQPALGDYQFTSFVEPVFNETVIGNNDAIVSVTVTDPIINPQEGDQLLYGQENGSLPFQNGWEIIDTSDPAAVVVAEVGYDPELDQKIYFGEMYLNTFTREFSAIWQLFPYWINPNVSIGDTIDLFAPGSGQGLVVDEGIINYYGFDIEVWIVDDGFELIYFTKSMGNLLQVEDYGGFAFIESKYTNVHPSVDVHNILISQNGPITGVPGENTTIDVFVYNTGEFGEDVNLHLIINGTDGSGQQSQSFFMDTGQWLTASFSVTPVDYGTFGVVIFAESVAGELLYEDNVIETTMNVVDLQNYELSNPAFNWYDARANGFNLNLFGDDVYTSVDFPFDFTFYDTSFSTVYISSNGWLSFAESDPWEYFSDPIPNEEHPYMVAPFFSDLKAEGNVYAWATPEFVVIEYSNYNYLWDDLVGTFEVVFFANGDILFQYQDVSYEDFVIKGLNYGINLNYYTILSEDLSGVTNYAGLFSLDGSTPPPPVQDGPDLEGDLEVPYPLGPGDSGFITATTTNVGTEVMYDVQMYLYIDGEFVGQMFTQQLDVDESITLNHYWSDVAYGNHIVELQVVEQANEVNFNNNYVVEDVFVSDEHDLWVWLQITENGSYIFLDAIVYNQGFVTEHDVELYIMIDGTTVSFGVIDTLEVNTGSVVSYVWNNPSPGQYNLTAFAPLIEPELNENNNVFSTIYTVEEPQDDTFVLQLFDADTFEGIPFAYVYMYGPANDLNINANTNSSGGLTIEIPADEYFLYVQAEGYEVLETYVIVDGLSYYEFYLTPLNLTESLTVNVYDNSTGEPVSYAPVSAWGSSTGYYIYNITDVNGTIQFDLPEDEFYVDVFAEGYQYFSTNIYVVGNVSIDIYLIPFEADSELVISVFDNETLETIEGAQIYIYGWDTSYSESKITNATGTASFAVPTDFYDINIDVEGYEYYYDFIYVEGFVYYEVYLTPVVLDATLAIQVNNEDNGGPVSFADVFINGISTGYDEYGQTNSSGFIEFTVPVDDFEIFVYAEGFLNAYEFVFVSNFTFIEVLMTPISNVDYNLTIIDPVNNVSLTGSNIFVSYNISSDILPELIEVYVNGEFISSVMTISGEIMVPIFEEGFNTIELIAYWSGGSASDTVTVEVYDLVPLVNVQVGDYFALTGTFLYDGSEIIEYSLTAVEQISEYEFYFNFTIIVDTPSGITNNTYYLIINTLNGYISEGDFGWVNLSFVFFNNLGVTDPNSDDYGKIVYFDYGNVLSPVNETVVDGYEAFEYISYAGEEVTYLKNGLLYSIFWSGVYDFMAETSLLETPGPEIQPVNDISFEYGTTGVQLIWNITTFSETYYNLTIGGVPIIENGLVQGDNISVLLEDLDLGSHIVHLVLFDLNGNAAFDEVEVTVYDTTAPAVSTPSNTFEVFEGEDINLDFNVSDTHPAYFTVYENFTGFYDSGNWTNGGFTYILSGLSPGEYQFIFEFFDLSGNSAVVNIFVTVLELDETSPDVRGPYDFSYEVNSSNNYITWDVEDENPTSYVVYLDGVEYSLGTVENNEIEILVDGLSEGRYNFTVVVTDSFGNTGSDEVIVYVIPVPTDGNGNPLPPGRASGFTSLIALLGLIGVAFVARRRLSTAR